MKRQSVRVSAPKAKAVVRKRAKLTEDEADAIISRRRLRQKTYSVKEVMRQAGYTMDR